MEVLIMLKHLSLSQKIFGIVTLLLGVCYVGFIGYVHDTAAHSGDEIHWVWYNAVVTHIEKHSARTFTVYTRHQVRYHNHHSHAVGGLDIKHKSIWKNVTDNLESTTEATIPITANPGVAYGTGTSWGSRTQNLDPAKKYQGGAYTNLINVDWDNSPVGGFAAVTKYTATFKAEEYSGTNPPVPVHDRKTSGHPDG